jgi:pantoate--beta-alanine ligase
MNIYQNIAQWQQARQQLTKHATLGFVPTMGNLHLGHASLWRQSQQDNDYTLVSIFVNPTQFNQENDFTRYPRTLDEDLARLEESGVDFCLIPDADEIYADQNHYQISETHHSLLLEGACRPGHYTGVLTVVMKLLQLAQASQAYFGEKDYQQYQLIHDMAAAFFMPVKITRCPTVREASGLPFSSRNNRLTPHQRIIAETVARAFHQKKTKEDILYRLQSLDITVEYLKEHNHRRFVAVNLDGIRLIDNYAMD